MGFKGNGLSAEQTRRKAELEKFLRTASVDNEGVAAIRSAQSEYGSLKDSEGKNKPSAAPFVTETQSWVALALKRMIAYAAENGFDKVAFATGQQNADLFDLSKQVDEVRVSKSLNDKAVVIASKGRRTIVNKEVSGENELAEIIGKELAEKANIADMRPGESISFDGDGLKVGGEGMRAFYDKIVPQVANDVLKKIGADTKVGGLNFVVQPEVKLGKDGNGKLTKTAIDRNYTTQGFFITDAMREKVLSEGLPLFSFAGRRANNADMHALGTAIRAIASNHPKI